MCRLDAALVAMSLAKSRERAKELIKNGCVSVNGRTASKPSDTVDTAADTIEVTADTDTYVGRGGLKLERALSYWNINVQGLACLDIGASTGGFTDCLIRNGAAKVYAVDVGHGQLAQSLLSDNRVISMEGTNIRNADEGLFKDVSFVCMDVSFISSTLIFDKISRILVNGGSGVSLVKPQFEAGRENIGKNGIVKSKKVHENVLISVTDACADAGLYPYEIIPSPVKGGDGNIEYLLRFFKDDSHGTVTDIKKTVADAFNIT